LRRAMSGLLSGLVQSIINRYLQKWLKNVTTEHATIWGGARRSEGLPAVEHTPRALAHLPPPLPPASELGAQALGPLLGFAAPLVLAPSRGALRVPCAMRVLCGLVPVAPMTRSRGWRRRNGVQERRAAARRAAGGARAAACLYARLHPGTAEQHRFARAVNPGAQKEDEIMMKYPTHT
jgi:hypothetical protein